MRAFRQERALDACLTGTVSVAPAEVRDRFETITAQTSSNTVILHRPEGKTNRQD
jgi:hypothetical protein